ncbi:MAG: SMP-30/gluconolactonase/LRE family protein [Tepidiformaceae bacterium]
MERAFREVASGLGFPEGPVALPDGDLLVTEIMHGKVARVKPDGTKSVFAVTGGGPNGMAVGPDGAYYVTQNGGFAWIERVGPDGITRVILGSARRTTSAVRSSGSARTAGR